MGGVSQVAGGTNQLLDALPDADRQRLVQSLSLVFIKVNTVLFEPGRPIVHIDFPLNCVVSLVTPLQGGAEVEVATVGNEGIVGVPLVLGGSLPVRAICSVAGWAHRLDALDFLEELQRAGALRDLVNDYLPALFGQISQSAACNRLHSSEERLARWLLMSHDRVGTDEFRITHKFLARMLGSRRATVTVAAGILQEAGLIRYQRGRVTIVDRAGLEAAACECYRVIETELQGVVQRAYTRQHTSAGRAPSGREHGGGRPA
jgi:CRP-like cAMP-binding protein